MTKPGLGTPASPDPAWRLDLSAVPARVRLTWPVVVATAGVALLLVYLQLARRVGFGSDGAVIAQQASDWLHGNPLLRGWLLPDISFYSIEIPEFAALEFIRGSVSPAILQIGEALNLTLAVLLAALAARGSATGREGVIRALIAGGILFAPTPGPNGTLMLGNPDHLATQLPLFAVWMLLDRARPRWWVPVTVAALLAWARVNDAIVLLEAEIPLLLVCATRVYRRRGSGAGGARAARAARGARGAWLREQWYDLSLAGAAIAAEGIALLVLRAVAAAGGFSAFPLKEVFAPVDQLYSHLWVTVESALDLFGADFSGRTLKANTALCIPVVHLAGVLLAAAATWYAVRRFFGNELMVQVLTVGAVISLLAYTLLGNPTPGGGAHDLMPVLPIGAVLAGRLCAGPLIRYGVIPLLTVWLALSVAFLAHDATRPVPASPRLALATWLVNHHLRYGLGDYYIASQVSVDSDGQLMVAPVNRRGGRLVLSPWNSATSWYNPAVHDATFFIADQMQGCPGNDAALWLADAERAFGPPEHTYSVAGVVVATWPGNLLLGQLAQVPVHRPSAC